MAGLADAITSLIAKIVTLNVVNNSGQTVPIYSRIWNKQFEALIQADGTPQYLIPTPAALVETMSPQNSADIGLGITESDLTFRLHLGLVEMDALDGTMEQNLTIYALRDSIITLLTDFMPTACSELQKVAEQQDYSHTDFYHYIIDFKCSFIDSKGDQTATQISRSGVTPVIIAGFNPIEILSVVYNTGVVTIGYRLLFTQDVKFTIAGHGTTDAGTQQLTQAGTYSVTISLSSGNYSLTAQAVASNFTSDAWIFTV